MADDAQARQEAVADIAEMIVEIIGDAVAGVLSNGIDPSAVHVGADIARSAVCICVKGEVRYVIGIAESWDLSRDEWGAILSRVFADVSKFAPDSQCDS